MVSGSFLPLFPRRSTIACPSDEYCFMCTCNLVAKTGSSSFLFVSKRVFPSKTKRRMDSGHRKWGYLQRQLYLVVFLDEGRVFCFCSILLWLSFITCLHSSQTAYTPFSGHKHVKQCRRTTLASKGNKQKNAICARGKFVSVNIEHSGQRPWFSGGGTFSRINPRPCERGLFVDVRHVWTPQNGSFRKRIIFKTYTCARSLKSILSYLCCVVLSPVGLEKVANAWETAYTFSFQSVWPMYIKVSGDVNDVDTLLVFFFSDRRSRKWWPRWLSPWRTIAIWRKRVVNFWWSLLWDSVPCQTTNR